MEKTRLLIIDDNKNLVDMIEEFFLDHKFIKVSLKAYSGEEGIKLIENRINDYDAIILDLIVWQTLKVTLYIIDAIESIVSDLWILKISTKSL